MQEGSPVWFIEGLPGWHSNQGRECWITKAASWTAELSREATLGNLCFFVVFFLFCFVFAVGTYKLRRMFQDGKPWARLDASVELKSLRGRTTMWLQIWAPAPMARDEDQ